MIDHLVEEYGVDLSGVNHEYGLTAHLAVRNGRLRTVKHLVEKHNVDIHERDWYGKTALDLAEEKGMTECAAVLHGYGARTREELEEDDWTESDDDWDSGEDSDADDDVM